MQNLCRQFLNWTSIIGSSGNSNGGKQSFSLNFDGTPVWANFFKSFASQEVRVLECTDKQKKRILALPKYVCRCLCSGRALIYSFPLFERFAEHFIFALDLLFIHNPYGLLVWRCSHIWDCEI